VGDRASELGLFVAGVGLALAIFIAEQLGIELPTCVLIALGVVALAMIVGGLAVPFMRHRRAEEPPQAPGPYGDPEQQLDSLLAATNQLANILENFVNWWPAIEAPEYRDRLPDDTSTITHGEAMQTLLYAFAQFFSAARTYEDHNRGDWHRNKDLKESVREVYKALGRRPIGPIDDESIMSGQLHRIGELSTERWRSAQARPFGPADFELKAEKDPQLTAALEPLRRFLLAAKPNTEAHGRVEDAEKAVKRVKDWLDKHHRP
jgi:hypothetical protein